MRRCGYLSFLVAAALLLGGCPKGNQDYEEAQKGLTRSRITTPRWFTTNAPLRSDPTNAEYKLRAAQARYDAGQFHVQQGKKALKNGDLQLALGEFQKAQLIDPSNTAADQEVKRTIGSDERRRTGPRR